MVFVGRHGRAGVKAFGKQAFHLLDAAFVGALFLHDLEQHGQVQRDNGDDGAGACHQALVHGHVGFALEGCLEFGVEFLGGLFQVLLGATDGAVAVDGVGKARSDVGVGYRLYAFGKDACGGQLANPESPVLAAHDLHGVFRFFGGGGFGADGADLAGHAVNGFSGKGLSDGLQHAAVHDARVRVHTDGRGHAVDNQVDLLAHLLYGFDDLLTHVVREGVAVESDGLEACGLGFAVEGHVVVPARRAGFLFGAFFFEGNADGVGTIFKGGRNAAGKPVTGGASHYQHGLGFTLELAPFGLFLLHILDLTNDVGSAALGVGVDAHVATNHGLDDHYTSFFDLAC